MEPISRSVFECDSNPPVRGININGLNSTFRNSRSAAESLHESL